MEIIEFSNKIKPSNNDKTNGLCKFPGVGLLNPNGFPKYPLEYSIEEISSFQL